MEVGGLKSEVGCRRSEVGGRKTETKRSTIEGEGREKMDGRDRS
jgi:hypothetical protein